MMIKPIVVIDNLFMGNTYVVGNSTNAIIIDPANDVEKTIQAVNKRNVLGIFLTHAHYDHFRYLLPIMDEYDVPCYLTRQAYYKLNDPSKHHGNYYGGNPRHRFPLDRAVFVIDKQVLELADNFTVNVLYTPGHSDCSLSLIIDDMLFPGDVLFKDAIGRSDLPTGDRDELNESLKRLLELEGDYFVYPGHDDATNLKDERKRTGLRKISNR